MTLELLLPVAFLAGFFGSGHCLGMCGPIVLLMENPQVQAAGFQGTIRRLTYNAGRGLFYVLLGAIAGAVGLVLTKVAGIGPGLSLLRTLAALLIIALGINLIFSLQVLSILEKSGALLWRRLSPLARHVLPISTPGRALGAGFVWGALPCGLVYSAVAIAATTGTAAGGSLIMLVFWSGTLPALLLAGASAKKLGELTKNPILRRLAGLMLLSIGIFALTLPYLHNNSTSDEHQHATVVNQPPQGHNDLSDGFEDTHQFGGKRHLRTHSKSVAPSGAREKVVDKTGITPEAQVCSSERTSNPVCDLPDR